MIFFVETINSKQPLFRAAVGYCAPCFKFFGFCWKNGFGVRKKKLLKNLKFRYRKMVTVICKQVVVILCTLSYCVATLKAHVYRYTPAASAVSANTAGPIFTQCPAISGYENISHVALFGCFFGLCDYWKARYSDDHIIILCSLCIII